jgi:hypothetical protein
MKLDWKYHPGTQLAILELDVEPSLRYETPDGGQTINKFVNGELEETFHMFSSEHKFLDYNEHPDCGMEQTDFDPAWPDELAWLADTFPDLVGANSTNQYNRMGVDGAVQGWDDYDLFAESEESPDPLCYNKGLFWWKHKETGKIYRTGRGQPQIPDIMHPKIYGPFEVTLEDVAEHNGTVL